MNPDKQILIKAERNNFHWLALRYRVGPGSCSANPFVATKIKALETKFEVYSNVPVFLNRVFLMGVCSRQGKLGITSTWKLFSGLSLRKTWRSYCKGLLCIVHPASCIVPSEWWVTPHFLFDSNSRGWRHLLLSKISAWQSTSFSQEAGVLNESNELGSRHNLEEDGWASPCKSCKDILIFDW